MEVIRFAMDGLDDSIQKTLTTRFVFDWRLKPFKTNEGHDDDDDDDEDQDQDQDQDEDDDDDDDDSCSLICF